MTKTPNAEQAAVLADTESRYRLIIAGAGSGKTQTLIWQILQDLANGADPARMVAITYTNAGADEIKARLGKQKLAFVGTLHAWCLMLLNRYGAAIGYRAPVAMIDQDTEERLIKTALETIKAGPKYGVSHVRAWKASGGISNPAAIAAKAYMKGLRAAHSVDFDSVLFEALRLIQHGSLPALACLYVDEFQDSGPWDAAIYEALAQTTHRLFVVGDPDQNIYQYRGGDVQYILGLHANPAWKTYFLNRNHRSGPQIIEAANNLIARNSKRIEKVMECARDVDATIEIHSFATPLAEAAAIAASARKWYPRSVAVLTRYNASIPYLVAALEAEGVIVTTAREDSPKWLGIAVSALNAILDPSNDLAASTWLHSAFPENAMKLAHSAAGEGMTATQMAFKILGVDSYEPARKLAGMRLSPEASQEITAAWVPDDIPATIGKLTAQNAAPTEKEPGSVFVGTFHSYKGKEAVFVYLAQCNAEVIPAKKTGEELEAERRLFYVACTRACRFLWISSTERYTPAFTRAIMAATPTPFIEEMQPA